MEIKIHTPGFRRMFYDMLRDTNSTKYSLTKFAALVGLIIFTATITISLIIMAETKIIDHWLIVELVGFVLTLLGFKNFKNIPLQNNIDPNAQKQLLSGEKINDFTDDTIKH